MYLIPGSKSRTPGITTGLNPYSNGTMYLILWSKGGGSCSGRRLNPYSNGTMYLMGFGSEHR